MPGINSRAGPGDVSVEDLDLRTREQKNWRHPLLEVALGELAEAVLENLPG